ncbi:MAG: sigma-70 family RNA polymerase sigma factor [Oscillospiraceae bacterium]|nr:sigma-70 family RNA polymerase sigma factor [Oscillospiraceae bacterium]
MFDELMEKYCGEIFEYCKSLLGGDSDGAEECTQEVFVTLYKSMNRLKMSDDVRYRLYKIAARKVKEYIKKNGKGN